MSEIKPETWPEDTVLTNLIGIGFCFSQVEDYQFALEWAKRAYRAASDRLKTAERDHDSLKKENERLRGPSLPESFSDDMNAELLKQLDSAFIDRDKWKKLAEERWKALERIDDIVVDLQRDALDEQMGALAAPPPGEGEGK